jgi:uncharacterized membrane protein HdeD (DUF308 family)
LIRHWWAVVLRGLVAIAFGVLALASPRAGMGAMVGFYAAFAMLSGALALGAAVRAGQEHRSWGVMLLEGVIGIGAGIVALAWPGPTMFVLTLIIGCWAVGIGLAQLVAAVRLRREIPHEWLLGLDGVVSVAFGVFALVSPRLGATAIVTVMGLYALLFGSVLVALGFRLGQMKALLPPRALARV